MRNITYITLLFLAASCFKKDEVLPKTPTQDFEVNLSLEGNQSSYIDLNNIASRNIGKTADWHLKFENSANGWSIFLNTMRNVAIHNTRKTDYNEIDPNWNTFNLPWQLDVPTPLGSLPALRNWGDFSFSNPKSFKNVYLISLTDNSKTTIYKLQILDASEDKYHIRYGTLAGGPTNSAWILKNSEYGHSYFSLTQEKNLIIEPKKSEWNICFTYLSDSISSYQNIPHVPTINKAFGLYHGIVLNKENTEVFIDTSTTFEGIDFFYARDLEYKTVDELHNIFYQWDSTINEVTLIDNLSVILKKGNQYYALKADSIVGTDIRDISIKIESKQL